MHGDNLNHISGFFSESYDLVESNLIFLKLYIKASLAHNLA